MPYLIGTNGQGVNLGAKVGWIFAGIAFVVFLFVTFFVPEFAGRSLEEVDELFAQKLWAWQFKGYKTTGVGARIAHLEGRTGTESDLGEGEKTDEVMSEGRVGGSETPAEREGDAKDAAMFAGDGSRRV
jgi:hypothetical protein